jgi:GT2 family glycosyltransferase
MTPVTPKPSVSVIMPVRDKKSYLVECLESVLPAVRAYPSAELIAVDNGSTDGALEYLTARSGAGQLLLLQSGASTVSAVRNLGVSRARGEIVCFIDSDCTVPTDYLARVVDVLAAAGAQAVGHKVSFPNRSWIERCWHNLHFIVEEGRARWLPGACFSVTAEAFRRVGGFREDLISGEDIELAARLTRAGSLVWSSPQLIISHLDNPRTLRAFYRKELWRGLGAGASGRFWHNRVLIMAFAHVGALLLSMLLLFSPLPVGMRVVLLLGLNAGVPLVSVLYRLRQVTAGGMRVSWWRELLPGMVLYWIYYAARARAAIRAGLTHRRSDVPA